MADPAFVQSASNSSGGSTTLAVTLNVTAGNALIVAVFDGRIPSTPSVADSRNAGAYDADLSGTLASDGDTCAVFSKLNCAGGSTTITAAGTSLAGIVVHEVSGLATSAAKDQSASSNTTGSSATSGATSATAQASEYKFGVLMTSGGGDSATAGSGNTLRVSNAAAHIFTEDAILSATGAQSAAFTITSGADEYWCGVVTYKAAGGGTTQSSSYSASGGISFGGAAAAARARATVASGGLSFAGSAALARRRATTAAGGLAFGGAASESTSASQRFEYAASGGLAFGGAASTARVAARAASGGIVLAGAAPQQTHQSTRTVEASGGLSFSGHAATQFTAAGGVASSDLIIRRRRLRR